jgi:hypothetical protein
LLSRVDRRGLRFDLCLYNAGIDPHEDCPTGGLSGITRDVLSRRERLVFDWCRARRLPVSFVWPVAISGGGLIRGDWSIFIALRCHLPWKPVEPDAVIAAVRPELSQVQDVASFLGDCDRLGAMRVRIQRGAAGVGGNCVELQSGGKRLVLDVGWPLTAVSGEDVALPAAPGWQTGMISAGCREMAATSPPRGPSPPK